MTKIFIVFDGRAYTDPDEATVLETIEADNVEDAVYEARKCFGDQGAVLYGEEGKIMDFVAFVDDYKTYPRKRK